MSKSNIETLRNDMQEAVSKLDHIAIGATPTYATVIADLQDIFRGYLELASDLVVSLREPVITEDRSR